LDSIAARWAAGRLGTFAFFLPLQAIGLHAATDLLRLHPTDVVALLGTPALAWVIWRQRSEVVRRPIVVAWMVLALAQTRN
jgi:hypothetical protein